MKNIVINIDDKYMEKIGGKAFEDRIWQAIEEEMELGDSGRKFSEELVEEFLRANKDRLLKEFSEDMEDMIKELVESKMREKLEDIFE